MAILKQTWVSGNLYVTESGAYVSASEFRGPLEGTASWAVTASHALNAVSASYLDPNADLQVNNFHATGDAVVDGDLKVLGKLTYVGVEDLRVKDHTIEINSDDSGSAIASANGAGVVIKNSDAAGDIELIYSSSDNKLHVNKTIAGTIDSASEAAHAESASRADSAAEADKVKFALSFGTGISKSVASYDGHEAVVIDVNTTEMEKVVVSNSLQAVSASIADQVSKDFTFGVTASDGTATGDTYNGSVEKNFQVDLSGLESKTHASASIADLQDQIKNISGDSGSGTIADRIQNALEALNGEADTTASGTAVSGGLFVLQAVGVTEASGTLSGATNIAVEVEKAGEAAKAKAELLGAASDATSSMTLYGVKNYVDAKTGDGVQALSQSVATDFSASNAARVALSQSVSSSIATVAENALNLVESSSYIAVSDKANNKQTISAKTQTIEGADATSANGLALAADVKSYVDSQVTGKNVSAIGDKYVSLNAANNAVTASATIKAIADATAAEQGLVDAYDAKIQISSSVAALSQSVAASDAAQDAKIANLEASASAAETAISNLETSASAAADAIEALQEAGATYVTTASFNTYASGANDRLDALESASATHVTNETFNSYSSSAAATASALDDRVETLESSSAVLDSKYVQKAGDTMSGDLTMNNAGIIFGDMKIVWNASEQAIEFVAK